MTIKRVVIDTNVLISAALSPESKPAQIVDWALSQASLLFSEETFAELETRLWRPKFDRYLSLEQRQSILHDVKAIAEWITPETTPATSYSRDQDDDKFVHLALAGKADWLISGDQDLLTVVPPPGLAILSPANALALI